MLQQVPSLQKTPALDSMRKEQGSDKGEGDTTAKALPSTQLRPGWLPQVMSGRDMTVLCLITVMLVSNVSLLAGAGGAAILYLCIGFIAFLIPSALICAQLHRLFPAEGAVYVWANKAFGNFWDTFVGLYCNWLPGVLGMTIGVVSVVTYLQALNQNWLTLPWQQGLVDIVVLIFAQALCFLPQKYLQRIINSVFCVYAAIFALLFIAAVVWLATGHTAQGDFSPKGWQIGPTNWPVFAVMIISLFGMEVPLNMGGEVLNQRVIGRYLLWGTVVTMVGYMLATFGITVVLPPQDAVNSALIAEVFSRAFGPGFGGMLQLLVNVTFVVYFVIVTVAFNVMFSRLLLLAGVDRRLPQTLRRLTANRVPFNATVAQTSISILFVLIIFFLAPAFAPSNQALSLIVFLVTINGGSVIWNIAMIGLFLSGMILFRRYAQQLSGKWIVPQPLLYIGAGTGTACSVIAIYSTLFAGSPIPQLLSNTDWLYWMLLVVFSSLAVGATYSFLVPETEDLVVLAGTGRALKQRTQKAIPTRSIQEQSAGIQNQKSRFSPDLAPPALSRSGPAPQRAPLAQEPFPGPLYPGSQDTYRSFHNSSK